MIRLERVTNVLPAGFEGLRGMARAEGYRMLDTLAGEWMSGANRFAHPGEALLAAYRGDTFAAIGGITLEPAIPGALRMRRFFVQPGFRRDGIGRRLALALLDQRDCRPVTCNAAKGSEAFWESLGFMPDRRDGYTHTHILG